MENAAQAPAEIAAYREALANLDWAFESIDGDLDAWRRGNQAMQCARNARAKLDPDCKIWNEYAPHDEKLKVFHLGGRKLVLHVNATEGAARAMLEMAQEAERRAAEAARIVEMRRRRPGETLRDVRDRLQLAGLVSPIELETQAMLDQVHANAQPARFAE
jgi:hypothetical protein